MGFWSRLMGDHAGITPNSNGPGAPPSVGVPDYTPGDPDGFELEGEETFSRSLPLVSPSPWDGWPSGWSTPDWQHGIRRLADTAWAAIDLNSSVLSSMPVYRTRFGRIIEPTTWMSNPDPTIYTSWAEFAKQLMWDYQLGEAFVMPVIYGSDGFPLTFRVVPPWMFDVEIMGGIRRYRLGAVDVTGEVLHIRYKSTTDCARGIGPLEAAGARAVTAELLQRYMHGIAESGGVTAEWITVEKQLNKGQADDLREQYLESRRRNPGAPGVLSGGADLNQAKPMSAKDMSLLELAQFTEARIAILLGVPPFLMGLPSGGDSMTYSNVSQLFDFHDRASLRPKANSVMSALSGWAVPSTQKVELNRDEYTRPSFEQRAEAWVKLVTAGIMSVDEVRTAERLLGDRPSLPQQPAPQVSSLTGGDQ